MWNYSMRNAAKALLVDLPQMSSKLQRNQENLKIRDYFRDKTEGRFLQLMGMGQIVKQFYNSNEDKSVKS